MPALSLAQTQRLLWQLITAPSGVADGLRALGDAGGLLADGIEAIIAGDRVLPAERRLGIYANMYFFRLLDAIKEDFPTTLAVVGADEFHNLTTDYLLRHPPTHPSLRYAARDLPVFLATHRLHAAHPFLSDLARFEWSLVEAFDAADAAPVGPEAFTVFPAEAWADLRLQLTPSLQVLALDWAVSEPWHRVQGGQRPGAPPQRATWLRTWRHDLRVLHREITGDEYTALNLAARGETFALLCEVVAESVGVDAAAIHAGEFLHQWLADGLITGCVTR